MKTKLNEKQKDFLFGVIFNNNLQEIYKIFDTFSINYLKRQKIVLVDSKVFSGWKALFVNNEEYTELNFERYTEWNKIFDL